MAPTPTPQEALRAHAQEWANLAPQVAPPSASAEGRNAQMQVAAAAMFHHWPSVAPHIQALVEAGADPNIALAIVTAPSGSGWCFTSLCMNAWNWLLDQQLDLNAPLSSGQTLLQMCFVDPAGRHGDSVMERFRRAVWERGVEADAPSQDGRTPLMEAALRGHTDWVERLIERGAQVNRCSLAGTSPLSEAASSGEEKTVRLLLKHGADLARTGDCPLAAGVWAFVARSQFWSLGPLQALVEAGARPDRPCGKGEMSASQVLERLKAIKLDEPSLHSISQVEQWMQEVMLELSTPAPVASPRARL